MMIKRLYFTPANKIERMVGADQAAKLSLSMKKWYGDGIPLLNVPGVTVMPGGEFVGQIRSGRFSNLVDFYLYRMQKTWGRYAIKQFSTVNSFSGFSDLIAEWTGGKGQTVTFAKSLGTQVVGGATSSWFVGSQPAAGGVSSASPGGRAPSSATTGAFIYTNASGGDTMHLLSGFIINTAGGNIMLIDRLFDVIKLASSTATESVSGVPTRYQGTTPGAADYPSNNFVFPEVTSAGALGATAHNWTVCQYTDQAGNTANSFPSVAGVSAAIANQIDLSVGKWFMDLATGDTGVKALTQMQNSASVTGALNFVIAHPLGMMACPTPLQMFPFDFISPGGVFNPARIFDSACLQFLSITPGAATAATLTGTINVCSG